MFLCLLFHLYSFCVVLICVVHNVLFIMTQHNSCAIKFLEKCCFMNLNGVFRILENVPIVFVLIVFRIIQLHSTHVNSAFSSSIENGDVWTINVHDWKRTFKTS